MRILHIGNFHDLWNEEGIAIALERNGHNVCRLQEMDYSDIVITHLMADFRPDVVLVAKLKTPIEGARRLLYDLAKKHHAKTVTWTWDLYKGLKRENEVRNDVTFKADFVLTPDGGNQEWFEKLGVKHHTFRQAIADEYCHPGDYEEKYANDVIFVGCANEQWPYREKVCRYLDKNYDFKRYGMAPFEQIRGKRLNTLYASAKIIIGDSVYAPNYWSNRLYETLGRGGFSIWPNIPGLDKEYEEGKHYVEYEMGNLRDLGRKVDYYLEHEQERKAIGRAAFSHTKENHTLKTRCKQLIDICQ